MCTKLLLKAIKAIIIIFVLSVILSPVVLFQF